MKKLLVTLVICLNSWFMSAQLISTLNISPTGDATIVDVNIAVFISTSPSAFIIEEHTIDSTIITMNICYFVNGLQVASPIYNHTFPVTVPSNDNYSIIINLYRSETESTCDYTEITDTATLDFTTPLTSIVSLSVSEFEQLENQIMVYPNPVNNSLSFSTSESLNINSIELYSVLGKKINAEYDEFNRINVSNLNIGIYFVIFHTDKGRVEKKIVVNN